jgi:hypothetical protein
MLFMSGFSRPGGANLGNKENTSIRAEGFAALPLASTGPGILIPAAASLREKSDAIRACAKLAKSRKLWFRGVGA